MPQDAVSVSVISLYGGGVLSFLKKGQQISSAKKAGSLVPQGDAQVVLHISQ
jgi:hypothetical protein